MKNNSCCDSTFLVVQLFFLKESLNERLMIFQNYPILGFLVRIVKLDNFEISLNVRIFIFKV